MDSKPRALLLVTLSEWGGAQHVVLLLAQHLRDRYDLTVACAPSGELVSRLAGLGVRVVEIPEFTRNPHPWQDIKALSRLLGLVRRERFDFLHAHSTKAGFLGRLAARIGGVPAVLFTAHGWPFAEGRAYWKRWLLVQCERLAARWTSKIICVSDFDRGLAQHFGIGRPDQFVVIHNGIEPGNFLQRDGDRVRQELGVKGVPVITFVGRLAPPKDPLTLLGAVKDVAKGAVILVGDGPLRPEVQEYVRRNGLEGRVVLAGERSDVWRILSGSDIFVLPSRWEGLPIAVIEAMMSGLPVVATRVGGVPELVEEGVTGFLVPPADPQALATALRRLVSDPDLRRRMGEAAREKALREFTQDRMLRETMAVYDAVLGGSRRTRASPELQRP